MLCASLLMSAQTYCAHFLPLQVTRSTDTVGTLQRQVQSKPYAIVKLTASWCKPCQAMKPHLEQAADEWVKERGTSIQFIEVDIDQFPDICKKYGIQSVPTLLLFSNGSLKQQVPGGFTSKADIRRQVKTYLNI